MYDIIYIEKKQIIVAIQKKNIMRKACAAIATTNTEETKDLGIVPTKSFTLMECAKTVI
jgi:hypothetical protein